MQKENRSIPKEIIHVFIIKEEEELYRNELKDIVLQENIHIGVRGIAAQRNFIQQSFPNDTNIFCLDDDIKQLICQHSKVFYDFALMDFVDYAFQHCRYIGAYIWGVYPVNNVYFSKNRPEISHDNSFIIGCFYGILLIVIV